MIKQTVIAVALAATLAACGTNSIIADSSYSKALGDPDYKQTNIHAVYELVPINGTNVDVSDICPHGIGKVETKHGFFAAIGTGITNLFTAGLGPQLSNTRVWCIKKGQ